MKVEGIEIEWWSKEKFKGRTIEIHTSADNKTTIDVPDNDILCDCCNSEITEFPVAIWDGMAYCKECFEKHLKLGAK